MVLIVIPISQQQKLDVLQILLLDCKLLKGFVYCLKELVKGKNSTWIPLNYNFQVAISISAI